MRQLIKINLLILTSLIAFSCKKHDVLVNKKEALINFTAEAGIESVTLTWDLPAEPVKGYIISYNPGGVYLSKTDGTQNKLVIQQLKGGEAYDFTISWLDADFNASKTVSVSTTPTIRPPGTFSGDLIFKNQSELDAFVLPGQANLENINGDLIIQSDDSGNINDLSVLKYLKLITGNLKIIGNPILSNLSSLSALKNVNGGTITIQNNTNLVSLCGIANVSGTIAATINGNGFNPTFTQILAGNCKAPDVVYAGTLTRFNTQAEVDALPDGITEFPGELVIGLTAATNNITDLSKFSKVRRVVGRLLIQFNPLITDLKGFRSLESVGNTVADEMVIRSNDKLTTLDGLQALIQIGRRIGIRQNPALKTLTGLDNLRILGENNITIGTCGNATMGNPLLTDYCALRGLIKKIGVTTLMQSGSCIDSYSSFNPTFQNILDGNCSK